MHYQLEGKTTMIKIYLVMKQIHRLVLYITTLFILFMSVTGIILKYPSFFSQKITFLDLGLTRYLHNEISLYFSASLIFMAITGIYMYIFPLLNSRNK